MKYELYSYRRCPYAMRARMVLHYAKIPFTIHEISLRDKPEHMMELSPKGTVPILWSKQEKDFLIDESLEIMRWALQVNDANEWLQLDRSFRNFDIIIENDTNFKKALDRYKYPTRYPDEDKDVAQEEVKAFLFKLNSQLEKTSNLCRDEASIEDIAIFPFIRQAISVDIDWFKVLSIPYLKNWLDRWTSSRLFQEIFDKSYKGF